MMSGRPMRNGFANDAGAATCGAAEPDAAELDAAELGAADCDVVHADRPPPMHNTAATIDREL